MSYLHDEQSEAGDEIYTRPRDREVTLSTGTILAIFFGLALLCGAFFGIGYNMGSKTRPEAVFSPAPINDNAGADFSKFKPSPGSPAASAPSSASTTSPAPVKPATTVVVKPAETPAASSPAPAATAAHETTASTRTAPPVAPARAPIPPTDASGTYMVQIAAVSHQEDADLLLGALRRKGYAVAAHSEAQDKLLHIQVGPFANKKDAEAMKQRLVSDGYLAIIK